PWDPACSLCRASASQLLVAVLLILFHGMSSNIPTEVSKGFTSKNRNKSMVGSSPSINQGTSIVVKGVTREL
ncbi:unnamed protein product, partial [Bubo scandiacus]